MLHLPSILRPVTFFPYFFFIPFLTIVCRLTLASCDNQHSFIMITIFWCNLCNVFEWSIGCCSSGMINLKELSLVSGKAAWMAYLVICPSCLDPSFTLKKILKYVVSIISILSLWLPHSLHISNGIPTCKSRTDLVLSVSNFSEIWTLHSFFCSYTEWQRHTFNIWQDIYCLDADGSLFDAALLAAVAAFSHCKICMIYIFITFFLGFSSRIGGFRPTKQANLVIGNFLLHYRSRSLGASPGIILKKFRVEDVLNHLIILMF